MTHDATPHLNEDELHDAADGTNAPTASSQAALHLRECVQCRADVERIRELLTMAAALPRSIEPPVELWSDIGTRIREQPSTVVPPARGRPSRWSGLMHDPRWLAAAAVFLILASSALTLLLTGDRRNDVARAPDSVAPAAGDPGAPGTRVVSDEYDRLDRELGALLAANRDRMQPGTVARVERNLAIIDQAIAEIRAALAQDPGNDALQRLLKASYGQKSALVRQVSAT